MGNVTGKHDKLTDEITLSEMKDGFWLYDTDRGMNLALRCKTKEQALLEALKYYKSRFHEFNKLYKDLKIKVDTFTESVIEVEE